MSICLLEHFVRSLGILFVSVVSLFSNDTYDEYVINIENQNKELGLSFVNTVPNYNQLPTVPELVVSEPIKEKEPVKQIEEKKVEVVQTEEKKVEVVQTEAPTLAQYTGKVTGYGPDCQGCTGEGYLACRAKDNSRFSLKYNGIYYNDDTYGQIRILAANKKFACGTIIKITKADGFSYMAIVLDRVNTVLPNGQELIDLAYSSQTDKTVFAVDGLTGFNMKFEVKRLGW